MKRRTFLKTMSIGAAGTVFLQPWQLLEANPKAADRNFVFVYFGGGWDHLMSLDPRDPNKFTSDNVGATKIELAWDLQPRTFSDGTQFDKTLYQPSGSNIIYGPAMEPMAKHFDKTCMIRGISMDTVTHQVGMRYFLTGMPPAGLNAIGSSLATRVVGQQGDLTPIPNLVVNVETYNQHDPSYASGLKVATVADLLTTLSESPQAPDDVMRGLLDNYRKTHKNCDPIGLNEDGLMSLILSSQTKSRFLVDESLSKLFRFNNSNDADMASIAKRYDVKGMNSPQAQGAMAYQAIKHQVAQCVTIKLAQNLDSHDENWTTNHADELRNGFKVLDTLITDLSTTKHPVHDGNLLDYTTVVVFSEFSRTTMLNTRNGRDHALVNSAMVLGAGVPHNTVIGKTSDEGMNPYMIDPTSGKAVESGGIMLTPRNIHASLMKGAGLDESLFRTEALPCLMNKA